MSKIASRENRLVFRPKGISTLDNFALTQTELVPLRDQQVLVRNLYTSVDADNVGGETIEAALSALRLHGRNIACGAISV